MIELINDDCINALKAMPDNSVDSVVTDPPYGLSFMGKRWDYDVPSEAIWKECLRVLKPGGHLLAFAGTRTQHRMAVRIEDAGFEIRDMIAWVYGSGFPKSHNLADNWKGWGTALKPALEPITLARKPLIGTVAANVLEHGTGALNVDGCRVSGDNYSSGGKNNSIAFGSGMEKQPRCDGSQGRWPANLIHDGSEEVVGLFPETSSGKMKQHIEGGSFNVFGKQYPRNVETIGDSGSAARFFYCAKASKADRDEGCEGLEERKGGAMSGVETRPDRPTNHPIRRNHHPTVKPTDLMRYLCRLVTPPGGIVLDPFMGSGSTGKAAVLEGFSFIGIEREAEYLSIAKARIENNLPLLT